MFELSGHLIDPIVRLMGRPDRVTPHLRHDSTELDDGLMDNSMAVLEWGRAAGTVTTASMFSRSPTPYRSLEIHGTRGIAVVRPIEGPATLLVDLAEEAGPYKRGQQTQTFGYERYIDDFIELAAAVRGEATLRTSAAEDLLVEETLLRASGMA